MNADDRMGDDLPDWAIALMSKYGPVTAMPFSFDNGPSGDDQWCVCTKDSNLTGCDMDKEDAELFALVLNRARELSAHGGDGGGVDVSDIPFDTVRKVVSALTWLGHSTPESQEEQAARSVELVNTLCREVLALATQQPAGGEAQQRRLNAVVNRLRDAVALNEGGLEGSWIRWKHDTYKAIAADIEGDTPAIAAHGGSGEGTAGLPRGWVAERMPNGDLLYGDGQSDYVRASRHSVIGRFIAALLDAPPASASEAEVELTELIDPVRYEVRGLMPVTRSPFTIWTECSREDYDKHVSTPNPCWEVRALMVKNGAAPEISLPSLPEPALTEQAEYLSNKYISYFTIDQMHAYAKAALTRSPAPDAEKIGPELAAAIEFLARPRVGRSSVISILENLTNECIRMKSRATRSPARVGGVTDARLCHCGAPLLYECLACSDSNYPKDATETDALQAAYYRWIEKNAYVEFTADDRSGGWICTPREPGFTPLSERITAALAQQASP